MKLTISIVVAITVVCMIAVVAGSEKDTKIGVRNPQIETSTTAVPEKINYQGVLTNSSGTVVPDNTYDITFRLYNADTGGTQLWSESQQVQTYGGLFNVLLDMPTSHFDGSNRWLGVEVGSDGEMSPRQQIASVPYACLSGGGGGGGDGHSLDASDGDPVDALYVDDDGNVGIGTKTPQGHLHVGEGTFVVTKPDNDVGIGTATPQAKLDVDGSVYFDGGSGDANADGAIDALDVLYIEGYILGTISLTKQQFANADFDGDGKVTVEDAGMIALDMLGTSRDEAKRYFHSLYGAVLDSTFIVYGKASIGVGDTPAKLNVNGSVYFEGGNGDVDLSGSLGVLDPVAITNYLSGLITLSKEQYARADVDGDGRVTSDDAVILANLILGISREEAKRMVHSVYGVGSNGFYVSSDATIAGNLSVGGASVPSAVGDLRIIRGSINANGSIAAGNGFSVAKAGAGLYDITFTTAFSGAPTVTATYKVTATVTSRMAMVNNIGTGSARIVVTNAGGTAAVDGNCEFIAIGPR